MKQKEDKSNSTEWKVFSNLSGMNMLREFEIVWLDTGCGRREQKIRVENSVDPRLRKVSVWCLFHEQKGAIKSF